MKPVLCLLLALATCGAAWADVQIDYRDVTGATYTMRSNGLRVRINGGQMPGYLLLDGSTGEFFIVDSERKEVIRVSTQDIEGVAADKQLTVSLKPRGGGEKIAGYQTGRFDLIASGLYCGTLNGSSELIRNRELKRMLEAMQGMHKLTRSKMARLAGGLTECQQASAQMADQADTSGFVMRYTDDQGQVLFEVLSVNTNQLVELEYYQLPPGMKVVDMDETMDQAFKQDEQVQQKMPDMDELMKQMQQSGGEMTPELQQQLQKMMEQLQQQAQ